jgi:hypothetical protein
MRTRILASAIMAGLLCAAPHAGNANPPSPKANAQIARPAEAYDALLSDCEQVMVGVAKAMPADKYDFTPSSLGIANFKFTGIRTFAKQVKHVAQQNYVFFSDVGRLQPDVDVDAIAKLKTKDDIVAALEASFAFAHKAVATLTIENAWEVVPGPQLATRATTAAHGIAHGYNHHGQLVEYERMNGIDPPQGAPIDCAAEQGLGPTGAGSLEVG